MHLTVILRITGTLLTLFSFSFLLPAAVALFFAETTHTTFFSAFAITLISGLVLWLPLRGKRELRGGDGFLVTALFYLGLGMFGAIPFWLGDALQLSFTDAVFESISGLTTTGATTILGLDQLPKSLLIYRQMLQWMGGMGIIVLAVAIYPMLGIGGYATVPNRVGRADERQQTYAADHRDSESAVVSVYRFDRCLRAGLLVRWYERVRRRCP